MLQKVNQGTSIETLIIPQVDLVLENEVEDMEDQLEEINL